jgi:hypothetical protein
MLDALRESPFLVAGGFHPFAHLGFDLSDVIDLCVMMKSKYDGLSMLRQLDYFSRTDGLVVNVLKTARHKACSDNLV